MATRQELDRLAAELTDSSSVERRREAAQALESWAADGGNIHKYQNAIRGALADSDEPVRIAVALATLHQSTSPALREAIPALRQGIEESDSRVETVAALVAAALFSKEDVPAACEALVPILIRGVDWPEARHLSLAAIWKAAQTGADIGATEPALRVAVEANDEDSWVAAKALGILAQQGISMSTTSDSLERALDSDDRHTAYHAARSLAGGFIQARDGERLSALLSHPSHVVREGAAEGVATSAGGDAAEWVIPYLTTALSDSASGVLSQALDGFKCLIDRGVDITDATRSLEELLSRASYKMGPSEWALREFWDRDHESDVEWSPQYVAAKLLTRHSLQVADYAAVATILRAEGPSMVAAYLELFEFEATSAGQAATEQLAELKTLFKPEKG